MDEQTKLEALLKNEDLNLEEYLKEHEGGKGDE